MTMPDMERCLERVLIVCVGGTMPEVSPQEIARAFEVERGVSPTSFSVHPYYPKNYIVVFDTHTTKDRVLQGGSIKIDCHLLLL